MKLKTEAQPYNHSLSKRVVVGLSDVEINF